MSTHEFRQIVEKIRPFTNYIYLHVLGEPLLHPQFESILQIAKEAGLYVNITTNGGLTEKRKETLLNNAIRQINISLHDAEENINPGNWKSYLQSNFSYAKKASESTYVCFRLWNTSNKGSEEFNNICLTEIASYFNVPVEKLYDKTPGNGLKLADHIFLQRSPRFEWPDANTSGAQLKKSCYALRDHIAILADGTVVPCCLDADANMNLGNIFSEDLSEIISKERALNIKKGFEQHRIVEPICATCGFIID